MFDIVLVSPQIAPNTGNVMRLCANTGARLHLVRPLGFVLSDRRLARAGLDYRDRATVTVHGSWPELLQQLGDRRRFAVDTGGTASYDSIAYAPDDVLVFGSEPDGLAAHIRSESTAVLSVPMLPKSRSLNLSNAVAVVVYEAWRQVGFGGAATSG